MLIENKTKAISKILNNDISEKVKNNYNNLYEITSNINVSKINKDRKENILKNIEIGLCNTNIVDDYTVYDSKQIYNLRKGYEKNIDISFYSSNKNNASDMALKRLVLFYNNSNDVQFNLDYFNKYNFNKVYLLFKTFIYNQQNPECMFDLKIIENEFNIKKAEELFEKHLIIINENKEKENKNENIVIENKCKEQKIEQKPKIEKDINDLSYGELADIWNAKHPNAKINSQLIFAQKNKKIAEMVYTVSIYNVVFKNKRLDIDMFIKNELNIKQKTEILNGLKYNLNHIKNPIPVEKYALQHIPAENMHEINKIMRLIAETNVTADIDYIINGLTNKEQLVSTFNSLANVKW